MIDDVGAELPDGAAFERPPPLGFPVDDGHPPAFPCPDFGISSLLSLGATAEFANPGFRLFEFSCSAARLQITDLQ